MRRKIALNRQNPDFHSLIPDASDRRCANRADVLVAE
jgi:hypothetical protein